MSHTYTKENPPVVKRNEVSANLVPTTFGKTSDFKGETFWTLECTSANQELVRKFVGDEIVNSIITRFLRKVGIDLFTNKEDNFDAATGHVIWDNILNGFQNLDTGGATLKELAEERDELIDLSNALIDSEDYQRNDAGDFADPARGEEITKQLVENNIKLGRLKRSIKGIQEKYAVIAAKRQASKVAARV